MLTIHLLIAHDFEDSAPIRTNYGNKLKRHAQYVQEGQLDVPRGAGMYTQVRGTGSLHAVWHS